MKDIKSLLQGLDFSDKESAVYLAVLSHGPAPVRGIALKAGVNRGTTYDILRSLMKQGLVSYYHQEKKQYFVAENPERLLTVIDQRTERLAETKEEVRAVLPEISSLFSRAGEKPVVRYYEGLVGIRRILEDVLETVGATETRSYVVYSSANIRDVLYRAFPDFTKRRIADRLSVRAIATDASGEEASLSERRWLRDAHGAPNYVLVYGTKTAFISVGANGEPRGVLIEDEGTSATQQLLFESLWQYLGKR
jgi:sugar-specific transcriptional regulator TrmB